MNSKLILAISSSILLTTMMSSPVFAATQKPAKMTCEEFLRLDDIVKPKVVYWVEGFDKKGKPDEVVFDVENTDNYYPTVVKECTQAPKTSLLNTVRKANTSHHPKS
jgi:hypothetical protein